MEQILNITFLSEALKNNPRSTLFAIYANELFERGETEKAISILENGTKIFNNYSSAFYVLGLCYQKLNQTEKFRNAIEKAFTLNPFNKNISLLYKEILEVEDLAEQNFLTFEEYFKTHAPMLKKEDILNFDEYKNLHLKTNALDNLANEIIQSPKIIIDDNEPVLENNFNFEDEIIFTKTYAEILVKQNQFDEAIKTYQNILDQTPEEKEKFLKRIEEIKILKSNIIPQK